MSKLKRTLPIYAIEMEQHDGGGFKMCGGDLLSKWACGYCDVCGLLLDEFEKMAVRRRYAGTETERSEEGAQGVRRRSFVRHAVWLEKKRSLEAMALVEIAGDVPHWWIRIGVGGDDPSFQTETWEKACWKRTVEVMTKYECKHSIACMEKHTKTRPDGKGGLHIHLLVPKAWNTGKTRFGKRMEKIAKLFMVPLNMVECSQGSELWDQRVKYILGEKTEEKMALCEKDTAWRKRVGLPRVACKLPPELEARIPERFDIRDAVR